MRVIPLAAIVVGASLSQAQTNFHEVPSALVAPHTDSVMVFDSTRNRMLLFTDGGAIWEYDGQHWVVIAVGAGTPLPSKMAYDPVRDRVVAASDQGTHEFDGTAWTQVTTAPTNPSQITYDAALQRLILLSYETFSSTNTAVWTTSVFDGQQWTSATTQTVNALLGNTVLYPEVVVTLAYDPIRAATIAVDRDHLRQFDGQSWTNIGVGTPNLETHVLHYNGNWVVIFPIESFLFVDTARSVETLLAGAVLEYFQGQWVRLQNAQGRGGARAWDPVRQRLVAVEPSGRTFEYYNPNPATASVTSIGQGCGATPSVLTAMADPWAGLHVEFRATPVPSSPFSVTFGALGFDNTSWLGRPLPLDLSPFGMPGCTSYVNPEFTETLTVQNQTADWRFYIPPIPIYGGQMFRVQMLSLTFPHPIVSNAVECVIGTR